MNVNLLIFSVISFIGITLVVDETIFGLGDYEEVEIPNDEAGIQYMTDQALGIMFCFVYVVANSVSKGFETYYCKHPSSSVIHEPKPVFFLHRALHCH